MKQIIDKLIQSSNTDDWLIAYEMITKHNLREFLYLSISEDRNFCLYESNNQLYKAVKRNGKWNTVFEGSYPKYAQL